MTMDMNITHSTEATGDPLIDDTAWEDDHVLSTDLQTLLTLLETIYNNLSGKTIRIPILIETKTLSSSTSETFSSIGAAIGDDYLLKFFVTGTGSTYLNISVNSDTTSGNYKTYVQFQESDGNSHHLTDWTSSRTFSRIYNQTPYRTNGESIIKVTGEGYLTMRTNFSMDRAGWGENGLFWYNSDGSLLDSITISFSSAVSGTLGLYKIVEITL